MDLDVLKQEILKAAKREEKLVILAGSPGSGKSRILRHFSNYNSIDLSKVLVAKLLSIPREQRSSKVVSFLHEIIEEENGSVLIIDNIGVLFLPELNIDPLSALTRLSREKTIVVAWVGAYDGSNLTWSEPSRPDYKTYSSEGLNFPIISVD